MSKKVIGALLAIVMVLSVFSLTALAAGNYSWENTEDAAKYKQTWGLADGGNGKVNVTLSTNYAVGPISFEIEGITSLDSVTLGNGYYAGASVEFNKTTGYVFIYPASGSSLEGKTLNNAVVATFTYTANGNAVPAIKDNPKANTVNGMNGKLMAARLDGKFVNSSDLYVGQSYTILPFGEAPAPEEPTEGADLALKSGVTGVVIDTAKTFGGAYAGAVYGFDNSTGMYRDDKYITAAVEATNGGSLAITKGGGLYGTGTTIAVKNADGSVSKTYVVIIFGDANCDGMINGMDITVVKNGEKTLAKGSPARLAANCHKVANEKMLHDINGMDLTPLVSFTKNVGKATFQSELAKLHYETKVEVGYFK